MNIVTLPGLKKARYAQDDDVKLPKLQRWARDGRIPGAFKQTPTSDWLVDLDEFDAAVKAAKLESAVEDTRENRLFRMVLASMREGLQ